MRSSQLCLLSLLALAVNLPAQLEIATVHGSAPYTDYGEKVLGVGDGNGDGTPDFVVRSILPGFPSSARLQLISGSTLSALGQVTDPSQAFGQILAATSDMDLDGNPDFLAGNTSVLRAYSGANGSLIWSSSVLADFYSACGIGDIDSDSRAEVAAGVRINGTEYIIILRGSDGSQMSSVASLQTVTQIASLGDVNGDGHHEIAGVFSGNARVWRTVPLVVVTTISNPGGGFSRVNAANVSGDARNEVILAQNGPLRAYNPISGQLLQTYSTSGSESAVVSDLDADGYDDFAVKDTSSRYGSTADNIVAFLSGATGRYLANWSHTPQFRMSAMSRLGDVDGDGFDDLLMGDMNASPSGGSGDGGYQLVSGRILATTYVHPVQCHGSPFAPELGMTGPIIGQTATLVGRDGPANTWGFVAFSPAPTHPQSLGFSGCTAWFDVNNWLLVHQQSPSPLWTVGLPIPNIPQLAGLNIALQSFYLPTSSPIGIDLSNGIWARIGF